MAKGKLATEPISSLKDKVKRDILIGSADDGLSQNTIDLYLRQVMKIFNSGLKEFSWSHEEFIDRVHHPARYDDAAFFKTFKTQNSDIIRLILSIYKNKESIVATLNAICKMTKNRYKRTFDYYNAVRKEISKQNKIEKLDNELTPEEMAKYISFDELMAVPVRVKSGIIKSYGQLFISKGDFDKMPKGKQSDYLKFVFDYVTLYLNVHYPIRLVWPTVLLEKVDGSNYLQGNKLFLNQFKNVKPMGAQILDLDAPTTQLIKDFTRFLKDTLGQSPRKILWRVYNGRPGEFEYTSNNTGGFSQVLSRIFVKYNGKPMSMNMIRHIVESNIIQAPGYAKLTNKEKHALHAKLLHSSQAANISYNKIANRNKAVDETPDISFEPDVEEEPAPAPPPKSRPPPQNRFTAQLPPAIPVAIRQGPVTRGRFNRRERLFHGQFTPAGSDHNLEIEIFQTKK